MLTLIVLVPILLTVIALRLVTRLLFGHHRGFGHRRHGFGGGLFTILSLVALDRLLLGRRW